MTEQISIPKQFQSQPGLSPNYAIRDPLADIATIPDSVRDRVHLSLC